MRIDARGRFIEKDDRWIVDHRKNQGELLFLSARQIRIKRICFFHKGKSLEQFLRVWIRVIKPAIEFDDFANADFVWKGCLLKHYANATLQLVRVTRGINAENRYISPVAKTKPF